MRRDYAAWVMTVLGLLPYLFPDVVNAKALFIFLSLSIVAPFPFSDPVLVPVLVHTTALVSDPTPVLVIILCAFSCLRLLSQSRLVPGLGPIRVLRLFSHLHPRSRSRSVLVHVTGFVTVSTSHPVPVAVTESVAVPVHCFSYRGPPYTLGTMHLQTYWALETKLSGTRKYHSLPAVKMTRAE